MKHNVFLLLMLNTISVRNINVIMIQCKMLITLKVNVMNNTTIIIISNNNNSSNKISKSNLSTSISSNSVIHYIKLKKIIVVAITTIRTVV